MSAIGAIGSNPFSNLEWLSAGKGVEETSGTLASKGAEETSGTVANKEPGLFDGREINGSDNSLFACNNDKDFKQEETAGQLASSNFSLVA